MNRRLAKRLGLHPARNRKEWVEQIIYWENRLKPQLPHIERHDLGLILKEIFRPLSVPRPLFARSYWKPADVPRPAVRP